MAVGSCLTQINTLPITFFLTPNSTASERLLRTQHLHLVSSVASRCFAMLGVTPIGDRGSQPQQLRWQCRAELRVGEPRARGSQGHPPAAQEAAGPVGTG